MIAVDENCRTELLAGQGWAYFANVLAIDTQRERERGNDKKKGKEGNVLPNPSEHRAMCLFVLAEVARYGRAAQDSLSFPQPLGHAPPVILRPKLLRLCLGLRMRRLRNRFICLGDGRRCVWLSCGWVMMR